MEVNEQSVLVTTSLSLDKFVMDAKFRFLGSCIFRRTGNICGYFVLVLYLGVYVRYKNFIEIS